MDIEQKAGHQAIERICAYYSTLEERPVISSVKPGYLKQHIPSTAPEQSENFQVIADDYEKFIIPVLKAFLGTFTHLRSPILDSTYESFLLSLFFSAGLSEFKWTSSPACTELESLVMDWAAQLLGLNPDFLNISGVGGGAIQKPPSHTQALQTTADDSSLIAIVAARSRYKHYNPEVPLTKLVIYTTTQTHSLGAKAGLVLGLSVRTLNVEAEDEFSLRGETLRLALEEDAKLGMKPFVLMMNCHPSLWVHVDAAWAGVALACQEHREKLCLKEINAFVDSFCTNFHKLTVLSHYQWGLVNLDASTLWVRDRRHLLEAMDVTPPFLRTKYGDSGRFTFSFILKKLTTIFLSHIFVDFICNSDILCLVTPPVLTLSVFRLHLKGQSDLPLEALNDLNKSFFRRLTARRDISLTRTVLDGVVCIRFAVGCVRTEQRHIQQACKLIHEEAVLTLEAWGQATQPNGC
ncbi:hypothetical protein H0H92_008284 [Tricholoma furcatifolium]|nr:hypothetical protein H0H92_008284 [Tricholoma furcatifolium]